MLRKYEFTFPFCNRLVSTLFITRESCCNFRICFFQTNQQKLFLAMITTMQQRSDYAHARPSLALLESALLAREGGNFRCGNTQYVACAKTTISFVCARIARAISARYLRPVRALHARTTLARKYCAIKTSKYLNQIICVTMWGNIC